MTWRSKEVWSFTSSCGQDLHSDQEQGPFRDSRFDLRLGSAEVLEGNFQGKITSMH